MVKSNLMLRCCCVGWHVAGQDFLLDYLHHLNIKTKEIHHFFQIYIINTNILSNKTHNININITIKKFGLVRFVLYFYLYTKFAFI